MKSIRQHQTGIFAALALLLGSASPLALGDALRTQLEALAQRHHIKIDGLDRLGDEIAQPAEGDLATQIKTLLADYNFMIVGQGSKIESINITSVKNVSPKPKGSGTVKTQRLGAHHQVQAMLAGPNNRELPVALLVDTGATTIVLPESLIASLGFGQGQLQTSTSQTASGIVPVKTGLLKSVKVGDIMAENIPVSFIQDQKLGGAKLLGMSYLSRFRFSLDDDNSELQLFAK